MSNSLAGNQGRLWAISEISKRVPRVVPSMEGGKVSEIFGSNTFNEKVMSDKLPRSIYKELTRTIRQGEKLNRRSLTKWRTLSRNGPSTKVLITFVTGFNRTLA